MMKDITITKVPSFNTAKRLSCEVPGRLNDKKLINDYAKICTIYYEEQQTDCRAIILLVLLPTPVLVRFQRICGYFITLAQLKRIFIQKY